MNWKDRNLDRVLRPEDFRITDDRYGVTLQLFKCRQCGFIFADDDEVSGLVALYEDLEDGQYVQTQVSRSLQMKWLLKQVLQDHPQAKTLLDIGAGAGLLVAEAQRQGLAASGVEPSKSLVTVARRVHGVDLVQGTYPHAELQDCGFDIVFLVDVIEHVSNPKELLSACAAALSPDGRLVVVTPDVRSLAARFLRRRWWHFRLAHVGYFDRHTLNKVGESAGLSVARTFRAKWFFPVAYLAERLEQYLPIAWWNRLANRGGVLGWLYERVIPLNLFDSLVVCYRRSEDHN